MAHSLRTVAQRYAGMSGAFSVVHGLFGGTQTTEVSLHARLEALILAQLLPGESLGPEQARTSLNGRYTFVYQGDGNLVLYENFSGGRPSIWDSGTSGTPAEVCTLQLDGNLVIYGPHNEAVWDTGTADQPVSRLAVQDDGNVVLYRPDHSDAWATGTAVPEGVFRMAVIGDSVMWGQGHREEHKFSARVRQYLAERLNGRPVEVQVAAHSGAHLDFSAPPERDGEWAARKLDGEIPQPFPSIAYQATQQISRPHAIDLVLMDGGINDVDILTILNPSVGPEEIYTLTRQLVWERLVPKEGVLDLVLTTFPNATIVVTNYFPIISDDSDIFVLASLLWLFFGVPAVLVTIATRNMLAEKSRTFYQESTGAMQQAVAEANMRDQMRHQTRHQTPRVRFVDAGFRANHAIAAPDAALYTPFEPDEVGAARKAACDEVYGTWLDLRDWFPHQFCHHANMGHPNPRGVQMYADAICRELAALIPAWAAP